ncbi:MAG: 16S rRNA (guanine(527)-N(7))-methyltransferase RsmG [Coriobacteriales bacterium]
MKQTEERRAALAAALGRLELDLDQVVQDQLLNFLDLVVEKNKVLNLTRITSFDDAVVLHLEDSLSILETFRHTSGDFLDIGTGGGFPGIPLGITTERSGVLLDSVKKKAVAVGEFIGELGLQDRLSAVGMRSEELAVQKPEFFGVVTARAVSSLPAVEELATPLLKPNGHLIAMRGPDTAEDIEQAKAAAKLLGLKLVERVEFTIGPQRDYHRSLCVFQKIGKPQLKLPRHPGFASKKPLV